MFNKIKEIFKKEEVFSCIIFDGKEMKYMKLTQKEIDKMKSKPECKDWLIKKQDEC